LTDKVSEEIGIEDEAHYYDRQRSVTLRRCQKVPKWPRATPAVTVN